MLEIDKQELKQLLIKQHLILACFLKVTECAIILNEKIFNVEHGPKGGDELNLVIKGKNYGWPKVSYGTNYLKDNGKTEHPIKLIIKKWL